MLILRVLRFHASAHSRRDLPEVTDCQTPPLPPSPPHPYLLLYSVTQSFLFISLNTLPLAKLQHSIFPFPFAPPPPPHFAISAPFPLPLLLPPPLLPRGFHHAQSFSIFNVFYLSTEERMCVQLPNKGKTPSCHLRKMLQGGGEQGGRSTGGQRELDNTGSGIKKGNAEGRE